MKAILLLGPTASGKTAVALALAERFPVEVVTVDSAQVYRGMDVGTAKPDAAERARVPHHLLDIVDPTQTYSAGRFREDATRLVSEIDSRGRIPILAGGTMLYFRALTEGLAELPRSQPAMRAQIVDEGEREGWPAMHRRLAVIDPEIAARLEPNDAQRIQRALEVHRISGETLSQLQRRQGVAAPPFETLRVALEPSERSELHRRIAERFGAMLRAGLVEELEGLRRRYALDARLPSMRAVGYRQAWQTLEGEAPVATLEARGVAATRQLAKRQLTWLRSMPLLERYDCLRSDVAPAIAARVDEFLSRPRRGT